MLGFLDIAPRRAAGRPGALVLLGLAAAFASVVFNANAAFKSSGQESNTQALTVWAGFADKQSIAPDAPIELTVNRPLAQGEGRLAVVVVATDLTDLFFVSGQGLKYNLGKSFPLPLGATELTVYLVAPGDDWREVTRFPLRVGDNATSGTDGAGAMAEEPAARTESDLATDAGAEPTRGQPPPPPLSEPPAKRRFGFDKLDITPQLNIGFKSQFAETHFPEANGPDRPTFANATVQGTWKTEMARGAILGLEALKSRPGGLRCEAGALDAWFTSNRQNFTQSNINDAERSRGYSARLLAKNKSERARLDGGSTRSYFYNPDDPLLHQGADVRSSRADVRSSRADVRSSRADVRSSRAETRSARYVDASYDLFKDFEYFAPLGAGGKSVPRAVASGP